MVFYEDNLQPVVTNSAGNELVQISQASYNPHSANK